jgi:hypothetical protein
MSQVDIVFLSEGGPVRVAEARTVDRDRVARSRLSRRVPHPISIRTAHVAAVDERLHHAPGGPRANGLLGAAWTPVAGLGKDDRVMVTAPPPARPDPCRARSRPPAVTVLREYW